MNFIPSFVRRSGRISCAQERHLKESFPLLEIPLGENRVDLNAVFGRDAPKIMEIGFGMGKASAMMAENQPQNDFWCVDVHLAGAGALSKLVVEKNLNNLKITLGDAVEVLTHQVAENALSGVYILFPDPWHKKRHHKRRLIQAPFVALLESKMKIGAFLHLATDWEDYAEQILEVLNNTPHLKNRYAGWGKRENRPLTKFEERGLSLQHGVWDVVFEKI